MARASPSCAPRATWWQPSLSSLALVTTTPIVVLVTAPEPAAAVPSAVRSRPVSPGGGSSGHGSSSKPAPWTSPQGLAATRAATTRSPSRRSAPTSPPGTARSMPLHLDAVAPVPAPIRPTADTAPAPAIASAAAIRPCSTPGRTEASPTARSNRLRPTTIGTRPAMVGRPRSCSSRTPVTPTAAARPNAEPPLRTTASIVGTVAAGSSRANSWLAGAPPRTSPEATTAGSNTTTVQPVSATGSLQCPTATPSIPSITTHPRRMDRVRARRAGPPTRRRSRRRG